MKNVLIISGHTDLENNSFANKIILITGADYAVDGGTCA